jgi:hypothetical protein
MKKRIDTTDAAPSRSCAAVNDQVVVEHTTTSSVKKLSVSAKNPSRFAFAGDYQ